MELPKEQESLPGISIFDGGFYGNFARISPEDMTSSRPYIEEIYGQIEEKRRQGEPIVFTDENHPEIIEALAKMKTFNPTTLRQMMVYIDQSNSLRELVAGLDPETVKHIVDHYSMRAIAQLPTHLYNPEITLFMIDTSSLNAEKLDEYLKLANYFSEQTGLAYIFTDASKFKDHVNTFAYSNSSESPKTNFGLDGTKATKLKNKATFAKHLKELTDREIITKGIYLKQNIIQGDPSLDQNQPDSEQFLEKTKQSRQAILDHYHDTVQMFDAVLAQENLTKEEKEAIKRLKQTTGIVARSVNGDGGFGQYRIYQKDGAWHIAAEKDIDDTFDTFEKALDYVFSNGIHNPKDTYTVARLLDGISEPSLAIYYEKNNDSTVSIIASPLNEQLNHPKTHACIGGTRMQIAHPEIRSINEPLTGKMQEVATKIVRSLIEPNDVNTKATFGVDFFVVSEDEQTLYRLISENEKLKASYGDNIIEHFYIPEINWRLTDLSQNEFMQWTLSFAENKETPRLLTPEMRAMTISAVFDALEVSPNFGLSHLIAYTKKFNQEFKNTPFRIYPRLAPDNNKVSVVIYIDPIYIQKVQQDQSKKDDLEKNIKEFHLLAWLYYQTGKLVLFENKEDLLKKAKSLAEDSQRHDLTSHVNPENIASNI